MPVLRHLQRRDDSPPFTPTITALLIALLVLVILTLLCVGALFVIRIVRRRRQAQHDPSLPAPSGMQQRFSHRRLTITAAPFGRHSVPIQVRADEKQGFLDEKSEPGSPVPEIRITFPDEVDGAGKKTEGRVVVVKISEQGSVGLSPCHEEPAPPYQQVAGERLRSLDLERIGGLREKGSEKQWA